LEREDSHPNILFSAEDPTRAATWRSIISHD